MAAIWSTVIAMLGAAHQVILSGEIFYNFGLEVNRERLVGLFGLVSGSIEPAMAYCFYLSVFVRTVKRTSGY
ncbi:hypothetical protein E2R58_13095 [Paenibacillus amylolyticus]|nr:hypothetical protein E2R58_13095 [Paenibacillus amylolyticus]